MSLAKRQEKKEVRKKEGTKEGTEESRPSALAEMAASRGTTEAAILAAYHSSFEPHDQRAEDKLDKELTQWLAKFAIAVDENKSRTQAWNQLKSRCDSLVLLNCLYLFTYFGKTTPDVLQDASRFLREGLDKLLPKYENLYEETSNLIDDPKQRLFGVLKQEMIPAFKEPTHFLRTAQKELAIMRDWAAQMGSYKTEARDFHLYNMATSVRTATGSYHFTQLATLIEAARVAHGAKDEPVNEENLKKRVERYITRMNLPRLRRPAGRER